MTTVHQQAAGSLDEALKKARRPSDIRVMAGSGSAVESTDYDSEVRGPLHDVDPVC